MLPSTTYSQATKKGAVAELEIATRAAELGIGVWAAYTVERYDLIFDLRPRLVRVQCKWASVYRDVIVVRCDRNRRNRDGLLMRFYGPDEIERSRPIARKSTGATSFRST